MVLPVVTGLNLDKQPDFYLAIADNYRFYHRRITTAPKIIHTTLNRSQKVQKILIIIVKKVYGARHHEKMITNKKANSCMIVAAFR